MSLTEFYKKLDAPLANQRWSWGSTRPDGSVVLRVWQDRTERIDGKSFIIIANHNNHAYKKNHGYKERLEHIKKISDGAKCLMVMCLAKDVTEQSRTIKSYNQNFLFLGGELLEKDEKTYIELSDKRKIEEFI